MTRGIENIDAGEKNEMAKWSGRNAHELRVSVKAAAINIIRDLSSKHDRIKTRCTFASVISFPKSPRFQAICQTKICEASSQPSPSGTSMISGTTSALTSSPLLSRLIGTFTEENLEFQRKILERSGLGESTYLPEAVLNVPPNPSMAEARKEAEAVMFGAVDQLFAKASLKPKDIGILIVNCSLFNPTPSLSAMVINHYKLRGNIISHNLGGMGCSAGLISIDLAKDLLQVHPNSYALVISMENITLNWYFGNNRSMLVSNCLFRMGGAAILLSNKSSDLRRSKYRLIHTVRTHKGSDDKCFGCVTQQEDENGKIGVSLSKDLMAVAGDALKTNITTLGPLVLPMSEQLLFFATLVGRKLFKMKIKPYIPDFRLAFEHFCIHAGGRAVLDELEKNLQLSEWHMEPSRMTLYRFGNTSSSSLWYELAYSEAKGRMRKGDRTWQIAFGSGFKCNSAVWKALRTINPEKEKNPWMDEIDQFPVKVPKISTI
ncbi:hypothetical protein MRB53_017275 [Persea americana]|uniref:Uncharacterized protein n=1 Tax=Persea americana TaxID=3435 RepID=A0ACC2M5G5_PERAE|nr:hypothetical protein MRB53_017275 [Persea americana]